MKNPNRGSVKRLVELPNIGPKIAAMLHSIAIDEPNQLIGQDPFMLFDELCAQAGKQYDPCVIDVFMAAIDYMEGAEAKPWWVYTEKRKSSLSISRS